MKTFHDDGRFERVIFLDAEASLDGSFGGGGASEDSDAQSLIFA